MRSELRGRVLAPGHAQARALVLSAELSFAMGFDPASGSIRDVHGGSRGRTVAGRVLVMRSGRGSSSASTALAEAIRLGNAPAAMLLAEVDGILAVGAIVARRLYGHDCPIVVLTPTALSSIAEGDRLTVLADDAAHAEDGGRVIVGP